MIRQTLTAIRTACSVIAMGLLLSLLPGVPVLPMDQPGRPEATTSPAPGRVPEEIDWNAVEEGGHGKSRSNKFLKKSCGWATFRLNALTL